MTSHQTPSDSEMDGYADIVALHDVVRAYTDGDAFADDYAARRYDAAIAARTIELSPLMGALASYVRGIERISVRQTGGGVVCVEATLARGIDSVTLYADEYGWSLTDSDGESVAYGGWWPDGRAIGRADDDELPPMPDGSGIIGPMLRADECDAAAHAFADGLPMLLGD